MDEDVGVACDISHVSTTCRVAFLQISDRLVLGLDWVVVLFVSPDEVVLGEVGMFVEPGFHPGIFGVVAVPVEEAMSPGFLGPLLAAGWRGGHRALGSHTSLLATAQVQA